jgi:hypothetical protein
VVVIQRTTIDGLRALRSPSSLAETSQRWVALLDQSTDEIERMAAHLHDGRRAAARAYGERAAALLERASQVAAPLGVSSCSGPALAPA